MLPGQHVLEKPRADRKPLALDVEILEERIAPAVDYFIKLGP